MLRQWGVNHRKEHEAVSTGTASAKAEWLACACVRAEQQGGQCGWSMWSTGRRRSQGQKRRLGIKKALKANERMLAFIL